MAKLNPGVNDLETRFPEIAEEWHPTKNGDLLPSQITAHSAKEIWWLYKCGHENKQKPDTRISMSSGCPYCNGQKVLAGFNDLETKYPDIASEWHPTKNGDLLPNEVTAYNLKKVWWLYACGHEKEQIINNRTKLGVGCPDCSENGYRTNKPGFFYIIWNPNMGTYGWIKIGISNNSLRRIAQHTTNWGAEVLSVIPFEDGNIPPQIEKEIKHLFGEHIAVENVERMLDGTPLDGYTETYPLTLFNDIEIIMDIVRKYQ